MHSALHRNLTALVAIFTAVLAVPACDAGEPTNLRLAAYTPEHAGMGLELADGAALELADGTRVELGLSQAQRDSLTDVCDGEATIAQVALSPLTVGATDLAAPVLEASCDGEQATPQLLLRDRDDACADGACVGFAAPHDAGLDLSAPPSVPLGACQAAGTKSCVSCGGGKQRSKVITTVNYDPETGYCTYAYTYGSCTNFCSV